MNISILAAGAGGMYCGSCMRDNALAGALARLGHSVTLVPLFSPLRTDAADASIPDVYYGGINVYLQHAARIFRHTPRVLDSIFDRPWLLNAASKFGSQTPPEKLADLTLDILHGEDGNAAKELERLVGFLRDHVKPAVVSLPNLMFIGMAREFRKELGVPVVCELTGEDIFLDAMKEEDRAAIRRAIGGRVGDVTRFVATSTYYADQMSAYLGVPRAAIDVVHNGVSREYFARPPAPRPADRPPTIGYLARICPEKGLSRLIDAFTILRQRPHMQDVRLKIAGYLGSKDAGWFAALRQRITDAGLAAAVEHVGEVDQNGKLALLDSIDVFSVPTVYPESKGIYVLEALARDVPVAQPAHGSFPELIKLTGGGVLIPPGDADALAGALAGLLLDPDRRAALGRAGHAAVEAAFTDDHMAVNMLKVYEAAMGQNSDDIAQTPGDARTPRGEDAGTRERAGEETRGRGDAGIAGEDDAGTRGCGDAGTGGRGGTGEVRDTVQSDPQSATGNRQSATPPIANRKSQIANPTLSVSDVWKEYPTPTAPLVVLRGVSFELAAGQTLAIVGPSGSGKSTLLNVLGTLDRPTRGSVMLGDVDPFALPAARLAGFRSHRIGFVFQDHHLLPQCTAAENVLIAKLAEGRVHGTDADRAAELLRLVGLQDRARHLPAELSGGERQRVAIARALMNGPGLLLCDEPTGNLDQKTSHSIAGLLLQLAADTDAILITVTHSPAVAQMFGRQLSMTDGILMTPEPMGESR